MERDLLDLIYRGGNLHLYEKIIERGGYVKQETYLICIVDKELKASILKSGMAFIRDWNLGFFEVPAAFTNEFKKSLVLKDM